MKICFLALAGNYHTIKWCDYFNNKGWEVHVISFVNAEMSGVTLHYITSGTSTEKSDVSKLKYLLCASKVKNEIEKIQPDIISVHYASSYGTVAALAGLKNYFLSVWGSDIYEFPNKSLFHKKLLQYSLKKAPHLLSTSKAMFTEGKKYTNKEFCITPFGVDMELFSHKKRIRNDENFVVGTIKALTPRYGIEYLIKAAAIIIKERPDIPLKVRIGGKGTFECEYKKLAKELEISEKITWLGFIKPEQVAYEWANMDVAVVYSSVPESFGVSAIEAEACGCPIIISDVPGLMEATMPGESSVVVVKRNERELANTIIQLYENKYMRETMGAAGRAYVESNFELNECFANIERLFLQEIWKV